MEPKHVAKLRYVTAATVSPDGKYVYIIGARPFSQATNAFSLTTPQSLLKVDAITLQPVKQLMIGARLHHGQIFQDRYLLLDSFARDSDGLDVMLYDPETDRMVGGVRSDELGGSPYTAFTDDEFIYVQVGVDSSGGAAKTLAVVVRADAEATVERAAHALGGELRSRDDPANARGS